METPFYGYQLKSETFKKIFGDFGINDGQLYPTLNRLEQDELITKTIAPQHGAPSRHIYSITPKGREEFLLWLTEDYRENTWRYDFFRKDPFLTRCNFIGYLEYSVALEMINQQIGFVQTSIDDLNGARGNMISKEISPVRISILEYGIKTLEVRLEWLKEFTKVVEESN